MTFAKAYLQRLRDTGNPNRKVLLVGAAYGGTGFIQDVTTYHHRWIATQDPSIGGDLYRGAVKRANDAIAKAISGESTSAFKGILWHQGEADVAFDGASQYQTNHVNLMTALRANITGASSAPIVVGEMTPCFWSQCENTVRWHGTSTPVSDADLDQFLNYIHNIHTYLDKSAWVSSAGLAENAAGDRVHFNRVSQRELGRRYFAKYWEAARDYTPPVIDLKAYNGHIFNVGTAIDYDPTSIYNSSTISTRINGNVTTTGTVNIATDSVYGNVVEILNSAGSLKLLTNASLFNGSYTKMAWVNLNSTNYRNHLISGNNATQSHYLYVSQPSKFLSAGHSSSTNPVNIYGQETSISPINVWRHIAVTYAISTQTMVLYVNGVAVSTNTAVPVATQATGSVNLDMSGYGSNVGFGLDGMMISNKVYSRALSASEVSAVFSFEQMRLWKAVIFLNPYPPLAVKVGGGKYQDNRTLKHVHNII